MYFCGCAQQELSDNLFLLCLGLIRHNKRKKASKDQNAATISEKEEHENDLYYEDSDHSCSEDTDGDDAEYEVDKEDYDYPSDIDMQSEPESDER